MKKFVKILIPLVTIAAMPLVALAQEEVAKIDMTLIPGTVEHYIEWANLIVAILAAVAGVKLSALAQGGALEKTWNWFAFALTVFAAFEIFGLMEAQSLVAIHGLREILEFVFAALLFYLGYSTRKILLRQITGK